MSYVLPRTILVFIAFAASSALIRHVWPSAEMPVFALAGASWLTAGVAYFGYLHKLKRDIVQLERALGCSKVRVRRTPLD